MRIGRTIIDTDNMNVEELTIMIDELRKIRARKRKAEELKNRMLELLADAQAEGFDFIDKDFGQCIRPVDIELWDSN